MSHSPRHLRPVQSAGREALLDATARVVAREGLRGFTYRAVGSESGTTHGLVSYHFGTRENLLVEAARRAGHETIVGFPLQQTGETIREFAIGLPALAAEQADRHAFMFELAVEARRNSAIRPEMLAQYSRFRAATGDALDRLGIHDSSGALARLVFAAIDGLALQQLLDDDAAASELAIRKLQDLLAPLAGADRQQPTAPKP
jgi:TetR/AcrR family transcriptional regulator, regulator of biofilm formation and stress response